MVGEIGDTAFLFGANISFNFRIEWLGDELGLGGAGIAADLIEVSFDHWIGLGWVLAKCTGAEAGEVQ